jgi:4-hydroxybenzoate polyprenyltransferase
MNVLREIVITTRPKQYVKNLLVFLGILFSGKFKDHLYDKGFVVLFAFVSFLLISSAVYIFNDLRDRNNDKTHPKKKNRPIASGRLSVQLAFCCLLIFLGSGFLLGYMIGTLFMMCLVVYIAINFLYSLVLKNVVILDVFCVSSGYVIRTLAGVFAVEAVITIWLILCIGFA